MAKDKLPIEGRKDSRLKPIAVLAAFTLVFCAVLIWHAGNHEPSALDDEVEHLSAVSSFIHHGWGQALNTEYPPFLYLSTYPVQKFFGNSRAALVSVNIIYLALLFAGLLIIGYRISGSLWIGVLACVLTSLLPAIYFMSRSFLLDFPCVALVCFSIAALLLTENFSRISWSVVFAVCCGFGMLTRETFPVFIFAPFILTLLYGIKDGKDKGNLPRRLGSIVLGLLIGGIIISIWYGPELFEKFQSASTRLTSRTADTVVVNDFDEGPLPTLFYYPFNMALYQVSWPLFAVFIFSLPAFIRLKSREMLFLILFLLAPFVILGPAPWRIARFITPVLPIAGLVTAYGILSVKRNPVRIAATVAIVLFALLQFSFLTFDFNPSGPKSLITRPWLGNTPNRPADLYSFRQTVVYHLGPPVKGRALDRRTIDNLRKEQDRNGALSIALFNNSPGNSMDTEYPLADIPVIFYLNQAGLKGCLHSFEFHESGNADIFINPLVRADTSKCPVTRPGHTSLSRSDVPQIMTRMDILISPVQNLPALIGVMENFKLKSRGHTGQGQLYIFGQIAGADNSSISDVAQTAADGVGTSHAKVVLLGIDGLDWEIMDYCIKNGMVPNMSRLISEGSSGVLKTDYANSPITWTTIGTGVLSEKHGIVPDQGSSPFLFTYKHVKYPRLWEVLPKHGMTCLVTDYFFTPHEKSPSILNLTPRPSTQLYPPIMQVAQKMGFDERPEIAGFNHSLYMDIESMLDMVEPTRQALAGKSADLVIAYLSATDVAAHKEWLFFRMHNGKAPLPAHLQDRAAMGSSVLTGVYQYTDAFVGEVVKRYPDTLIIIVSDHGAGYARPVRFELSLGPECLRVLGIRNPYRGTGSFRMEGFDVTVEISEQVNPLPFGGKIKAKLIYPKIAFKGEGAAEAVEKVWQFFSRIKIGDLQVFEKGADHFIAAGKQFIEKAVTLPDLKGPVINFNILTGEHFKTDHGIFIIHGPKVRPGTKITGVSVEDVAPTIYSYLGIPLAGDFDGKPIVDSFEPGALPGLEEPAVPTYGQAPHYDPEARPITPEGSEFDHLRNLGYM